jgi:predicted nucleic acid-binding protein
VILLVDTDVLLDVALAREPFADPAGRLLDHLQGNPGTGVVAWHSISNFYYLARSSRGDNDAREFIHDLVGFLRVVAGGTDSVRTALVLPMADFEDALQAVAGQAADADLIATRNVADYRQSPIPAKAPRQIADELGI